MSRTTPRLPFAVLLTAALSAAIAISDSAAAPSSRTDTGSRGAPLDALMPLAPAEDAVSSTHYCAAGTGLPGGMADHTVVVVNPGDEPVTARVTPYGGGAAGGDAIVDGPARGAHSLTVGPGERAAVRLGDLIPARYVAAVVEVEGGPAVVEHEVEGPLGRDGGPCATRAGTSWHLAWGSTTRDAREVIVVFNPFPSPASVDVVVRTDRGGREPVAFQGVPVPGAGVVALDVGTEVRREHDLAATVTARRGRVVVERLQSFDGSDGPSGLSVALASPEPAPAWAFAGGEVGPPGAPVIAVYNPGRERAEVEVAVLPGVGAGGSSTAPPHPFGLSIGPGDLRLVRLGDEARVPAGVGLAVLVTSRDGVPVVAERVLRTAATGDGSEAGLAAGPGSPVAARTWWVGGVPEGDASPPRVTVFNPDGGGWAQVTLRAVAGRSTAEKAAASVPPGGQRTIRVDADTLDPGAVLVLEATAPVVAERAVGSGGVVRAQAPGVPEADGVVALRADAADAAG